MKRYPILLLPLLAALSSIGWVEAADLLITNGTTTNLYSSASYSYTYVGYTNGITDGNSLVVANTNKLTNYVNLYIGYNGKSNSLVISNSGNVDVSSDCALGNAYLIIDANTGAANYFTFGSSNLLVVTGDSSFLNSSGTFKVNGSGNILTIDRGGSIIVSRDSTIGNASTNVDPATGAINSIADSNNIVTVTGSRSVFNNRRNLNYQGGGNAILISDGGSIIIGRDSSFGSGSTYVDPLTGATNYIPGSNNSLTVKGIGSVFNNSGDFNYQGSEYTLIISDGGSIFVGRDTSISSGFTAIDPSTGATNYLVGSNNILNVTGTGSVFNNSGDFNYQCGGSLIISQGGGLIVAGVSTIRGDVTTTVDPLTGATNYLVGSNNILNVTGTGSVFNNSGDFNYQCGGSLTISQGGCLIVGRDSRIGSGYESHTVDPFTGATNYIVTSGSILTVRDAGSVFTNNRDLNLQGSFNSLMILYGGVVSDGGNVIIGKGYGLYSVDPLTGATNYYGSGSNNAVTVNGAGSLLNCSGSVTIGCEGVGHVLTVANHGSVSAGVGITIASQVGSSSILNIGALGGNDTAGMITSPTITFGSGSGTINFNQSDASKLSISISGAGALNQLGVGTTILTGSNSYTGTTTIVSGTLLANNTAGSALGSSSVNVQSGGTLGGNGLIGGDTVIVRGGNLTPGSSGTGALAFTAGLALQSGSITTFQINTKADFTSINILGNSITYGGNLVFNILNYTPTTGDTFTLFNMTGGATQNGDFTSVTAGSLVFADNSGIWRANDGSYLYQFSDSTGQLIVQSAPEPSTYALFGIGAIGMLMVMRKKKAV